MPVFYFDLSNGTTETDEDGTELVSLDEARTQSVKLLGELLSYNAGPVWDGGGLAVEVFDESRNPLFTVKVAASDLFPDS